MPAGWYPDPERTAPLRWWDGQWWTAWQAETEAAGYPPPGPVERVAPVESLSPVWARRALLGAGVGLAVATGIGIWGRQLLHEQHREAREAWPTTLGEPRTAPGLLNMQVESTNVVRLGSYLSAQLPPSWRTGTITALGTSMVVDHLIGYDAGTAGWNAQRSRWLPVAVTVATVILHGKYPSPDLVPTAGVLANQMAPLYYKGAPGLRTGPVSVAEAPPVGSGHRAARASLTVSYTDAGSSHAELRFTVIGLAQDSAVVWGEVIPEVASEAQRRAVSEAWGSLWLA